MPKFDWETFLGNFVEGAAKTGLPMFKDIRGQQITMRGQDIAQQNYQAENAARMMTAQTAREKMLYEAGMNNPPDEQAWTPASPTPAPGIGSLAQDQVSAMAGSPMSLNAAEGLSLSRGVTPGVAEPGPPSAPRPSLALPSDVPGLIGGAAVRSPADMTLEETRKAAQAAVDPGEKARLFGQVKTLADRQQKEVAATLTDLNTGLKDTRGLEEKRRLTEQTRSELNAKKSHLLLLQREALADPSASPEQRRNVTTTIEVLDNQIKHLEEVLMTTPLTLEAQMIELNRATRALQSYGVNPELIQEYRRAYMAGDTNIGYLGRQIILQASGSKSFGTTPKHGRALPQPGYGAPQAPKIRN